MRLFVAIELSETNRARLARLQDSLRRTCHAVKWIPAHQMHMTVKFLGDVPDDQVVEVAAALDRAASGATGCSMELAGAGCFPPKGPVRIVWTGAAEPTGTLTTLADAVESELSELGFPRERRSFSPHITIGRVRDDDSDGRIRAAVEAASHDGATQIVDEITLMSSVLSTKGPTYTAVRRARIGRSL